MGYKSVIYRRFTSERNFGVELEVSNTVPQEEIWACVISHSHRNAIVSEWTQTHNNRWWHIKTDSTCGPTGDRFEPGYEVASYKACGIGDIEHIADVAGKLKEFGVEVNDNCGLHVHVDVSDFSPAEVGVFLGHWFKCENFLFSCVPLRRYYNKYCNPLRRTKFVNTDKHYGPKQFWEIFRPVNLSVFENPERRVALNVMNYATGLVRKRWKRKTLELRLPESTLDPYQVRNWIRFFIHFVDVCKTRSMPYSVAPANLAESLDLMGLGHDESFYLYSPDLMETRVWLLERCIQNGWGEWVKQAKKMLNLLCQPVKSY